MSIVARRDEGRIVLLVEDNGTGFDAAAPAEGLGWSRCASGQSSSEDRFESSPAHGAGHHARHRGSRGDPDPDRRRSRRRPIGASAFSWSARMTSRPSARPATGKLGAWRMARELKPDIVLLDVVMPGVERHRRRCRDPDRVTPIRALLMLSMQDDPTYVRQAFASGARRRRPQGRRGRGARRGGAEGRRGRPVRPPDARRQARGRAGGSSGRRGDSASDREREVLKLLALGPHEPGDRAPALRQRADGRSAPGPHPEQAPGLSTRAELVRHAIDTGLLSD